MIIGAIKIVRATLSGIEWPTAAYPTMKPSMISTTVVTTMYSKLIVHAYWNAGSCSTCT